MGMHTKKHPKHTNARQEFLTGILFALKNAAA